MVCQMSVEKRSIALKQIPPFGLREKSRHALLEDLARQHHYLRPPLPGEILHSNAACERNASKLSLTLVRIVGHAVASVQVAG